MILKSTRGFSVIELLMDAVILAVVSSAVVVCYKGITRKSVASSDKAFATQKAIQLVQELRWESATAGPGAVALLDSYDDQSTCNYVLTVAREVQDPADPLSGNPARRYCRIITVTALNNSTAARQVSVKIFAAASNTLLADTLAVLQNPSKNYSPAQVFDIYVLALEATNYGWTGWGSMAPMKAMLGNVVQDLQSRRPAFEVRLHWITRMSYGRDPYYAPAMNLAKLTTESGALPWVYLYPGAVAPESPPAPPGSLYYDPNSIGGRLKVDGALWTSPTRYSQCDANNPAVRYPDEVTLYQAAVDYATANGLNVPEISWRMLIEKMNSNSSSLENILLISLQGEAFPFPAMHNYSDAAKDPVTLPNYRLVTHPEQLRYSSGATSLNLRVYGYVAGGPTLGGTNVVDAFAESTVIPNATILVKNVPPFAITVTANRLVGNSTTNYQWQTAILNTDYTVTSSGSDTLITLLNTPIRQAYNPTTFGGLATGNRMYGLEYIPSETAGGTAFSLTTGTLATPGVLAKNTARWVLTVQGVGALPDGQYTFETRLGTDLTTGSAANVPSNLSRTYAWVGSNPPVTEQYQFMGDPRHMPYVDIRTQHGYNWYFRNLSSNVYANGRYSKTTNGWGGASPGVAIDAPRYFQLVRNGILKTHGIFANAGGYACWFYVMGGEITGFSDGTQRMLKLPWVPTASATATTQVDETALSGSQNTKRLIASADGFWVSLPWIGELYPDSAAATWQAEGNLPTGSSGYYRGKTTDFSYFPYRWIDEMAEKGNSSLTNASTDGGGTALSQLQDDSNTGQLLAAGSDIAAALNISLLNTVAGKRPFSLTANNLPPEWSDSIYSGQRAVAQLTARLYDASMSANATSLGLIHLENATGAGYFLYDGIYTSNEFVTATMATTIMAATIRSYLEAGTPSITQGRIPQIPRIAITAPNPTQGVVLQNPLSLAVDWTTEWLRWDGQRYTSNYASGFSETLTVVYNVKYSPDSGKTWFYADDGSPAKAGVAGSSHALSNPYPWDISALPRGTYLLRVEGYRNNLTLHYGYHQCLVQVIR